MSHSLHSLCAVFLFTHAGKRCRRVPVPRRPRPTSFESGCYVEKSICGCGRAHWGCGRGAGVRGSQGWLIQRWGGGCCWHNGTTVTGGFRLLFPRVSPQNPGQRRFLSSYHFISSLPKKKKNNILPGLSGDGASFVLTSSRQNSHKCSSIHLMPSLWVILCLMLVRGKLPEQI